MSPVPEENLTIRELALSAGIFFPSSFDVNPKVIPRDARCVIFFIADAHARRPLRYRANIAYSTATYMHSQFLRLAIGRGQGWLEKSRCVARLVVNDTHWKRERAVVRSANDICRQRVLPAGQILFRARDTTRYREYYFPRVFFVINANCGQRAGGLAKDLRQSGIAKKKTAARYRLPFHLNNRNIYFFSSDVYTIFRPENYVAR